MSARPPEREAQARRMRRVNLFMRPVLSLPFPTPLSRSLMLAYLTGRRSGRRYVVPLSYVRDGETLLTPGGGRWKHNLVAGQTVMLRIAGRRVRASAELISDPEEVAQLLELMDDRGSRVLSFGGLERGGDGQLDPERVAAAVRGGLRVVRWQLR